MEYTREVMSLIFELGGTVLPLLFVLAMGLAALLAWQRLRRPVLSKLADGFPGGKHLIPEAEEEVVKARFADFQEIAYCQVKTKSITAQLEMARKTLVKIKKMRDSRTFADDEDLQHIYDQILAWGAKGVGAIFEESRSNPRPGQDLANPEDQDREG